MFPMLKPQRNPKISFKVTQQRVVNKVSVCDSAWCKLNIPRPWTFLWCQIDFLWRWSQRPMTPCYFMMSSIQALYFHCFDRRGSFHFPIPCLLASSLLCLEIDLSSQAWRMSPISECRDLIHVALCSMSCPLTLFFSSPFTLSFHKKSQNHIPHFSCIMILIELLHARIPTWT